MAEKTILHRTPPPPCPILEGLKRLEDNAREGDAEAAQRIHEIEERCKKIRFDLPAKVTKKPCKPTTPTNALALRLLEIVKLLKKYGRGGSKLYAKIKRLPQLTRESFSEWWLCAWAITKDVNFCDDEMNALIDEIGVNADSVQKKFQARKDKLIMIAQEKDNLAPGIDWRNVPTLCKKFTRQADTASNEWRKYVEKQTRKAAERIWFKG